MKVTIVTCFESNEERVNFIYDACQTRGYEVKAYSSDFSHIRKQKRTLVPDNITLLTTRPYQKNLSMARIFSHMRFAKDVFALLEKDVPDLIWLIAPANSLIRQAKAFKKKHPEVKLIIDIIDMWPESLPVSLNKDLLPFRLWKDIRAHNIDCADVLVSECDMYQAVLKDEYKKKITTIYWARDNKDIVNDPHPADDKLVLVYIGSINNIIDIDRIIKTIAECESEVVLHVIGEGESTDTFLARAKEVCEVIYHGPVREEKQKQAIFDQCHAGLNVYREDLYIGFTTKCIDYFAHGLPIINTIKGDTWQMVKEHDAGIDLEKGTRVESELLKKQRQAYQKIVEVYNENFTKEVFTAKCLELIDEVSK